MKINLKLNLFFFFFIPLSNLYSQKTEDVFQFAALYCSRKNDWGVDTKCLIITEPIKNWNSIPKFGSTELVFQRVSFWNNFYNKASSYIKKQGYQLNVFSKWDEKKIRFYPEISNITCSSKAECKLLIEKTINIFFETYPDFSRELVTLDFEYLNED